MSSFAHYSQDTNQPLKQKISLQLLQTPCALTEQHPPLSKPEQAPQTSRRLVLIHIRHSMQSDSLGNTLNPEREFPYLAGLPQPVDFNTGAPQGWGGLSEGGADGVAGQCPQAHQPGSQHSS